MLLLAACTAQEVAPASPQARAGVYAVPVLPTLPASVVDAPISYALAPLRAALEQSVPRRFGNLEQRHRVGGNARRLVAFTATRTPFRVTFADGRATLEATVSYQARGWYRPVIGPTVSASCGTGDTMPRITVRLVSDVALSGAWQLGTTTRLVSAQPTTDTKRDQCTVTFLDIDVTDHVIRALEGAVRQRLPGVDRKLARIDVKARVTRWFGLLQRNIRVTDSLWLQINPDRVGLGKVSLIDSALVAEVRLTAHPRLVTGPAPVPTANPLPPLGRPIGEVGDSARLHIEGLLGYPEASAALQRELAGRRFSRFGRAVRLEQVRLYPLADGRVVLAVRVVGGVRGEVFLVGTPQLDTATRTLTVPDLDFDVATSDALVAGVAWLKKADLVAQLRQSARFPLDTLLEETRRRVEQSLNRDLTEGVRLSGAVRTGRLVDAIVHPLWLIVRAEAAGTLALDVDRPLRRR